MDVHSHFSCTSNNFNIISSIVNKLHTSPLTWLFQHIKGHQDTMTVPMYIWDYINVFYDIAARLVWASDQLLKEHLRTHPFFPGYMWLFLTNPLTDISAGKRFPCQGSKIVTNMKEHVEENIYGTPLLRRWHKIGTLNKKNHHHLYWKVLKGASWSASTYCYLWATVALAR